MEGWRGPYAKIVCDRGKILGRREVNRDPAPFAIHLSFNEIPCSRSSQNAHTSPSSAGTLQTSGVCGAIFFPARPYWWRTRVDRTSRRAVVGRRSIRKGYWTAWPGTTSECRRTLIHSASMTLELTRASGQTHTAPWRTPPATWQDYKLAKALRGDKEGVRRPCGHEKPG